MGDRFNWLEHTIVRVDGSRSTEVIASDWHSAPSVMLTGDEDYMIVYRKPFGNDPQAIVQQEFRRATPAPPPGSEVTKEGMANCPYCEPFDSWGGSDEMWAELKRKHEAGHATPAPPPSQEGDENAVR